MSVLFALVLFFTSISTKLSEHRNRMFVLDIAIVGVVIGAIILALSPISLTGVRHEVRPRRCPPGARTLNQWVKSPLLYH